MASGPVTKSNLSCRAPDIPNYGLPALIHMNMLNTHELRAATPEPP